jgi:hypothetical protein
MVFACDAEWYIDYADQILKDSSWLHKGNGVLAFRMPGFPLLIAAWKCLLPCVWQRGVLFTHLFFLGISAYFLYLLAKELRFRPWIRRAFLFCYITGKPLLYAGLVLTDSMFLSFSVIAVSILSLTYLQQHLSLARGLVLFLVLVCSVFWRDTGIVLILSCLPICAAVYFRNHGEAKRGGGVKAFVLCLSALAFSSGTILQWNKHRTGKAIISTSTWRDCQVWGDVVEEFKAANEGIAQKNPYFLENKAFVSAVLNYVLGENGSHCGPDCRNTKIAYWMTFTPELITNSMRQTVRSFVPLVSLSPLCASLKDCMNYNTKGIFCPISIGRFTNPVRTVFYIGGSLLLIFFVFARLGEIFANRLCRQPGTYRSNHSRLYLAIFLQILLYTLPHFIVMGLLEKYALPPLVFTNFLGWWALSDLLHIRRENLQKAGHDSLECEDHGSRFCSPS